MIPSAHRSLDQHIFDSVKASLQRLQLDYIDVLQCTSVAFHKFGAISDVYIDLGHRFDNDTPIGETVCSLTVDLA